MRVRWGVMRRSKASRVVERLRGSNYGLVRVAVGNLHVGTDYLTVVRTVKRKIRNWDKVPRGVRRGVIYECLKLHKENRGMYKAVMWGGR